MAQVVCSYELNVTEHVHTVEEQEMIQSLERRIAQAKKLELQYSNFETSLTAWRRTRFIIEKPLPLTDDETSILYAFLWSTTEPANQCASNLPEEVLDAWASAAETNAFSSFEVRTDLRREGQNALVGSRQGKKYLLAQWSIGEAPSIMSLKKMAEAITWRWVGGSTGNLPEGEWEKSLQYRGALSSSIWRGFWWAVLIWGLEAAIFGLLRIIDFLSADAANESFWYGVAFFILIGAGWGYLKGLHRYWKLNEIPTKSKLMKAATALTS